MECHREFPWWKVIYNGICFSGLQISGLFISARLGILFLFGYITVTALSFLLTWATICNRCAYYGHRCALAMGKIAPLLRRKGDEAKYCRTKPQLAAVILLGISFLIPIAGGLWLAFQGNLLWPVLFGIFLLALALPHPRLMCRYCEQRERGACAIGAWLVKS